MSQLTSHSKNVNISNPSISFIARSVYPYMRNNNIYKKIV